MYATIDWTGDWHVSGSTLVAARPICNFKNDQCVIFAQFSRILVDKFVVAQGIAHLRVNRAADGSLQVAINTSPTPITANNIVELIDHNADALQLLSPCDNPPFAHLFSNTQQAIEGYVWEN